MGSCYSCKGDGGAQTYTTIKMDNKSDEISRVKPAAPYGRMSNTSFGVKCRLPTALKSLSQDRTSELVHNYESKIASINNSSNQTLLKPENNITNKLNATNRNLHSNIPRFNSKISTAGISNVDSLTSSNVSINALDPNCNTLIEGIAQDLCNSIKENKKMGSKYALEKSKNFRRIAPKENESIVQNGHKVEHKETAATKAHLAKAGLSSTKNNSKSTLQTSGLPKPQIIIPYKRGCSANNKDTARNENAISSVATKAPLAKFDDIDLMHASSDTLTEEENLTPDSGIGTSMSEKAKKLDADSETLVEVSELAKDTCDGVSVTSEKIKSSNHSGCFKMKKHNKTDKIQKNSNIYRPHGLPVPTKHTQCLQSRISSPTEDIKRHVKLKDEDHSKIVLQKQLPVQVNLPETKEKHIKGMKMINNKNTTSVSSTATDCEGGKVENIDKYSKSNLKKKDIISPEMSPTRKVTEGMHPNTKKIEEMSSSVESSSSQQESFQDGGLCSPPSERETFLIDDEIADQPELIACQPQELHGLYHSSQDNFCLDHEHFLGDEGNGGQDLYRSNSMEALSTSSINSDDLMLDFDGLDDTITHNVSNWSRTRRLRSCSASEAQTRSLTATESPKHFGSPKSMSTNETDDSLTQIDTTVIDDCIEDASSLKADILKLERILKEANTLNPFDSNLHLKNGLLHNLAVNDPPQCCISDKPNTLTTEVRWEEENIDLRRQVVYLEQELAEKNKTIKLLQQQMVKYVPEALMPTKKELCNAATQTDKSRHSLTTLSQSYEDAMSGPTVSTNGRQLMEELLDHSGKGHHRTALHSPNITQSLNSLTSSVHSGTKRIAPHIAYPPERSASAVELCSQNRLNSDATSVASSQKHSVTTNSGVVKKKSTEPLSQPIPRSKIAVRSLTKGTLPQQPKMGTGVKCSKTASPNRSTKNSNLHK